jgi:HSP20 family molecular chaperone IbpA
MTTLTLRRWFDPFAEFDPLFRSVAVPQTGMGFRPAAEVVRDGDDALVRLELPGIDPEKDVTVELENSTLVVKGERRDERSEESNGRRLHEVRYGSFRRAFQLPSHVTDADLTATYDAGVLTVKVTGVYAGSTPTRIPVTSSGAAGELKAA